MTQEADPAWLAGLAPDERLLGEDSWQLPAELGRPEEIPPSATRRRIVAVGATLTAATLVLGGILAAFGAVDFFATGFDVVPVIALFVGLGMVATHWGWVHVAELYGQRLERRGSRGVLDRRRAWLSEIEPYPRWEVRTEAREDGSITISTVCHRPVARSEGTFTFARHEIAEETHPAQEPAADVAERAEALRRQAALETARAREEYQAARDRLQKSRLTQADEQERQAAARAASQALSERINTNLREPPLAE